MMLMLLNLFVYSIFIFATGIDTISTETFEDFKTLMMYFNEPLLKKVTIKELIFDDDQVGNTFEGSVSDKTVKLLAEAIESAAARLGLKQETVQFAEYLKSGTEVMKLLYSPAITEDTILDTTTRKFENIQNFLISSLDEKGKLVIPSGWTGPTPHAIGLIVEKVDGTGEAAYNLIVVNTGDGIQYHYKSFDPKGNYPYLARFWIEFKGIPKDEIFSDDFWFMRALAALNTVTVIDRFLSASQYFYGSILANFREYLVTPDQSERDKAKMAPPQRSGSCALSSLMACFLYLSETALNYSRDRVLIGHEMIEKFLRKYENEASFLELIQEGFEPISRKLFLTTASSLAQQLFLFLERKYPQIFMNAGLLGKGRLTWTRDKLEFALRILANDQETLGMVEKTISLALEVKSFIEAHPIEESSLEIIPRKKEQDENIWDQFHLDDSYKMELKHLPRNNPMAFLQVEQERPFYQISNFNEFILALDHVRSKKSSIKVLDVLKRNWLIYLDESGLKAEDIMKVWSYFTEILSNLMEYSGKPDDFDDLILLAHLQIANWKCALKYDQLTEDKSEQLGLDKFRPPLVLDHLLYDLTNSQHKNWNIRTSFSPSDFYEFESMLGFYSQLSFGREFFIGPGKLISLDGAISLMHFITELMSPLHGGMFSDTRQMFDFILNNESVKQAIDEYKSSQTNSDVRKSFEQMYADLEILFTEQEIFTKFPHFFRLVNNSLSIYMRAYGGPFRRADTSKSSVFQTQWKGARRSVYFKCRRSDRYMDAHSFYTIDEGAIDFDDSNYIPRPFDVCNHQSIIEKVFYAAKHSMISRGGYFKFDSWFNHVKGAQDPSIFDEPYFLYLSDRILNIPLFRPDLKVSYLSRNLSHLYFDGISVAKIDSIFNEFMRLIGMDLKSVIQAQIRFKGENVNKIMKRALNMAIILVRFINRIEYDGPEPENSNMLSDIYNLLFKFCSFKSSYNLEEELISAVNIVLAQICFSYLKKPQQFIENLKIDGIDLGPSPFTLGRVHWFLAKKAYSSSQLGKSQLDDLFHRGFVYYPVIEVEKPTTTALLKLLFLSKYEDNLDASVFDYSQNGDLVTIHICDPKSENTFFAVQLSSGNVVRNGEFVPEKSKIFNSEEFNYFFIDAVDKSQAKRGELSMINSTIIYTISDYKREGNAILILNQKSNYWILRNFNGKWYKWEDPDGELNAIREISYHGFQDYKIYSHLYEDILSIAFVKDDESIPLIHFKIDLKSRAFSTVELPLFPELRGKELLIADCSFELSKIFKTFAYNNIEVYADEKDEGKYEYFYNFFSLKLKDDPKRQFVVYETLENEFRILNRPGWIVETKQKISDESGMMRTLLVRNPDGQKFIFIPLIEKKQESKDGVASIEEIPMTDDGKLAPQTLQQRLLLAFTSIKAYEYTLARELLHPSTSITHNEPFTLQELKIIKWIMKIDGGGPETAALMLMAYLHYRRNMEKFPLEYGGSKKGIAKEIDKNLYQVLYNYLFSIRDLPEKYYVYRMFPEFLDSDIISKYMSDLKKSLKNACSPQSKSALILEGAGRSRSAYVPIDLVFGSVSFRYIDLLFNRYNTSNVLDEKFKSNWARYIKLMSRFIVRQSTRELRNMSNEMLVYCAAKAPELFDDIKSMSDFNVIIDKCQEYRRDFEPINMENISTLTSAEEMIESFRGDMIYRRDYYPTEARVLSVTDQNDLDVFKAVYDALKQFTNEPRDEIEVIKFEESVLKTSKVLCKLKNSMASFLEPQKQQQQEQEFYNAGISNLLETMFSPYLSNRIKSLKENLQTMTAELSAETGINRNNNSIQLLLEGLNRVLHVRKPKTFESLYACYQRQSVDCIHRKFTQLSLAKCSELLDKSTQFYSNQVFLDYLLMLQATTEKFIAEESVSIEDLNLFLDELKKIEDFNSRLTTPTILNFEFRSKKYRLRSEQVSDIKNFITSDDETGNYKSSVIQRMMAAGKTLVLGTIAVVMKALDDTKLSILVPPSSLYQSNLSSMQARTYSFFKAKGSNFIFPRFVFTGSSNDIGGIVNPFLDSLIKQLENTMKSRDYLVLSPDTLQSFLNSYVEALHALSLSSKQNDALIEAIEKFAKIYKLFRTKGSIILDEIDMTMDPKKELNFPTTSHETFNMSAVILLTDLMEFSVFDEEIKSIGLNILANNQSSLTSENYEKYRELLLGYVYKELGRNGSIWRNSLLLKDDDLNGLLNVENIMEFLKEEDNFYMKDWIEDLLKVDKRMIVDVLIILKVQIWQGIKDSMRGEANLNYGSAGKNRPKVEYAVPYVAANTPSPSSEFADRWETMNKTLLMLAATSCSESTAKKMIGYIKRGVTEELSDVSDNLSVTETNMYKNTTVLLSGINPLTLNDSKCEDVVFMHSALMTRSPAAIRLLFSYAIDEIFSKMKFPVEQITSNALNMVSMFGSLQGYSGTIDNVNILPQEVIVEAHKNHMENEKMNGGIAIKLVKDSGDSVVMQLNDLDLKGTVTEIVRKMIEATAEAAQLSALIDVGAFFKNFKNRTVAESILTLLKPRIKTVLYYEEISNQVEYIRSDGEDKFVVGYISSTDPESILKATRTEVHERFTFYDQRHITGSDIVQPKRSCALMTVGARVLLRDILQGTLRMRQFMTSQRVHLVTNTATVQFYQSKVKRAAVSEEGMRVTDILTLGALNEDEKQMQENKKLAFSKIDNEIRRFVLDELSALTGPEMEKIIKIWFERGEEHLQFSIANLFLKNVKENPLNWLKKTEEKETKQVLFEYAEQWKMALSRISSKIEELNSTKSFSNSMAFSRLLKRLEMLTTPSEDSNSLLSFLNPKITLKSGGISEGTEVESRVITEQLAETNLETFVQVVTAIKGTHIRNNFVLHDEKDGEDARISSALFKGTAVSLYEVLNDGISDSYKSMTRNVTLSSGFRAGISLDLMKFDSQDDGFKIPNLIFSRQTLEGSQILIQEFKDGRGTRVFLLSNESANEALRQMEFTVNSKVWICDLSGNVSAKHDIKTDFDSDLIENLDENTRLMFFDLLIFNGSLGHILKSRYLRQIYYEKWLTGPFMRERARFLLMRMTVLMDKIKHVFAPDNREIVKLKMIEAGSSVEEEEQKHFSSAFKKQPIGEEVENDFLSGNNLHKNMKSVSHCDVDHDEIYENIFSKK